MAFHLQASLHPVYDTKCSRGACFDCFVSRGEFDHVMCDFTQHSVHSDSYNLLRLGNSSAPCIQCNMGFVSVAETTKNTANIHHTVI